MEYQERTYRNSVSKENLVSFQVKVGETDLYISAEEDLTEITLESVYKYRRLIEEYIKYRPQFLSSLVPIEPDKMAPAIIRDMLRASGTAGVGPMASVAGAIAQYVGLDLLKYSDNIIVENGGDIFLKSERETNVGIFAGESPLSYKVALRIRSEDIPLGICTSSGTVGHSLSLGKADAVCVTSKSASLADAAATSIGNRVNGEGDIKAAIKTGADIEGILGILIIVGDKMGAYGAIELV
ncbi:MAG: UPF0280 family protein [Proteobacteria bacterium]|nr:UPF0280 family protein [Pseudomonadota bacterium]